MQKQYDTMLPTSDVSVNSTRKFIQILKEYEPQPDDYIISLDVTNQYPSINLSKMTEDINSTIQNRYTDPDIINTMQSETNLILNECYFIFNNNIYKQVKDVPMGSPISNVVTEWKMR